jgi:hypothetical protein
MSVLAETNEIVGKQLYEPTDLFPRLNVHRGTFRHTQNSPAVPVAIKKIQIHAETLDRVTRLEEKFGELQSLQHHTHLVPILHLERQQIHGVPYLVIVSPLAFCSLWDLHFYLVESL